MPSPGEYKTVQSRILAYAQEIGWSFVPRDEADRRRGFDPAAATPEERARKVSLFFGDLLHSQVRAFNPKYKEAEGALVGEFQWFHSDIYGNRDFLTALRNQHKFFSAEDNRELDVTLIDYAIWLDLKLIGETSTKLPKSFTSTTDATVRVRTWSFSSTASLCW